MARIYQLVMQNQYVFLRRHALTLTPLRFLTSKSLGETRSARAIWTGKKWIQYHGVSPLITVCYRYLPFFLKIMGYLYFFRKN